MNRALNEYRVAVDPTVLSVALVMMALEFGKQHCALENCETCSGFVDEWHDLYEALDQDRRQDVRDSIRRRGGELPHMPLEGF